MALEYPAIAFQSRSRAASQRDGKTDSEMQETRQMYIEGGREGDRERGKKGDVSGDFRTSLELYMTEIRNVQTEAPEALQVALAKTTCKRQRLEPMKPKVEPRARPAPSTAAKT